MVDKEKKDPPKDAVVEAPAESESEQVSPIEKAIESKADRKFTVEPDVPVRCACDDFIPLDEFLPHPNNPNKHPDNQIALLGDLIAGYNTAEGRVEGTGWRLPVTVSTRPPHYVTKGHGRLMAARRKGLRGAPVDYQHYDSEEQELADLVADNKIAEFSKLDEKLTKPILERLNTQGFSLRLTGYDGVKLTKLLESAQKTEPVIAEYQISAELGEKYDYVCVFVRTEMDRDFLFNLFGIEREQSSKKSNVVGVGRVITFERFLKSLAEQQTLLKAAFMGMVKEEGAK